MKIYAQAQDWVLPHGQSFPFLCCVLRKVVVIGPSVEAVERVRKSSEILTWSFPCVDPLIRKCLGFLGFIPNGLNGGFPNQWFKPLTISGNGKKCYPPFFRVGSYTKYTNLHDGFFSHVSLPEDNFSTMFPYSRCLVIR